MKISDLFDGDLFRQMQTDKMVTLRSHEGHPLTIANYSDLAAFKKCWNDVTTQCRGLIYEQLTGNVIARPLSKFWNLGEAQTPYIGFDDLVEVTDKADGSLGIIFVYDDQVHVSTRGSFHSSQAEWATQHIRENHNDSLELFKLYAGYTFLAEIIYPSNRIVLDYGDFAGLVVLDCDAS